MRVQPVNFKFLDRRQRFRRVTLVKNLLETTFANRIQHQPMLLPQNLFLLLVGEMRAVRLFAIRGCAFADTASFYEDLCLQQEIRFSRLALHVVNRVLVLNVGIEAKNHAVNISVVEKGGSRNDYGSSGNDVNACPSLDTISAEL